MHLMAIPPYTAATAMSKSWQHFQVVPLHLTAEIVQKSLQPLHLIGILEEFAITQMAALDLT